MATDRRREVDVVATARRADAWRTCRWPPPPPARGAAPSAHSSVPCFWGFSPTFANNLRNPASSSELSSAHWSFGITAPFGAADFGWASSTATTLATLARTPARSTQQHPHTGQGEVTKGCQDKAAKLMIEAASTKVSSTSSACAPDENRPTFRRSALVAPKKRASPARQCAW